MGFVSGLATELAAEILATLAIPPADAGSDEIEPITSGLASTERFVPSAIDANRGRNARLDEAVLAHHGTQRAVTRTGRAATERTVLRNRKG